MGFRKASFSYRWAENYHLNFGAPRGGILRDLVQDDYINAEGTAGSIIKIDNNTLIIKGKDNMEKTVLISNQTTIRSGMTTIGPSALKVDDKVIIIGSPNNANGQIEAKFIRLFFAK